LEALDEVDVMKLTSLTTDGRFQNVAFQLDWSQKNAQLLALFKNWLEQPRPQRIAANETRGAGNPARQYAKELKALGALRLHRRGLVAQQNIFSEQSSFIRARRIAERVIATFHH